MDPWIQDPENSQSFNRYSYVWNNPLRYTDPTGEEVGCAWGWCDSTVPSERQALRKQNRNVLLGVAAGVALAGCAASGVCSAGLTMLSMQEFANNPTPDVILDITPVGKTKKVADTVTDIQQASNKAKNVESLKAKPDVEANNNLTTTENIKPEAKTGFHATDSEAANLIVEGGFKNGTKPGRLGSGGVYVNDTPQGAVAEFANHSPDAKPSVIEVTYNPGVNASSAVAPQKHVMEVPLNVDSISAPSVRAPTTTNTNIINNSAEPKRILDDCEIYTDAC